MFTVVEVVPEHYTSFASGVTVRADMFRNLGGLNINSVWIMFTPIIVISTNSAFS
jgi:hypothetical protein